MVQPHITASYVQVDYLSSRHKLKRIMLQESFKSTHEHQFKRLTRREIQIVELLVSDLTNPEIAKQLHISRYTVEQHRKNINRKLGVHSLIKLFEYALAFDLV